MNNKGFSLVEIVISIAIFVIVAIIATSSMVNIFAARAKAYQDVKTLEIAREGVEICYNISVRDWNNFKVLTGEYHPAIDDSNPSHKIYYLAPGVETLENNIERKIVISKAKRDSDGNVTEFLGTPDENTLKVDSIVEKDSVETKLTIYLIDLNNID